ncbi:MAG: NERD domain-containing protein [Opitutae bacterium]|nr:NERD domain-containing protein [Opitutae bacterium]
MAKILRSESSLLHRQNAIGRELSRRKITRLLVWAVAAALMGWGGLHAFRHPGPGGFVAAAFVLVLAIGYEVHLREIARESRNLEGGRRGEQKMAELLAERLADDHVILNDLELRVAHERAQIDHLVIAPSGIYVVESKFWAGKLTGDVCDAQWTQRKSNGSTRSVKSPVQQVERQRRMFITLLAAKVPEDRIHALAVFTHPAAELHIANAKDRVFRIPDAIRFINDRCFEPPVLSPAEVMELAEQINRGQA